MASTGSGGRKAQAIMPSDPSLKFSTRPVQPPQPEPHQIRPNLGPKASSRSKLSGPLAGGAQRHNGWQNPASSSPVQPPRSSRTPTTSLSVSKPHRPNPTEVFSKFDKPVKPLVLPHERPIASTSCHTGSPYPDRAFEHHPPPPLSRSKPNPTAKPAPPTKDRAGAKGQANKAADLGKGKEKEVVVVSDDEDDGNENGDDNDNDNDSIVNADSDHDPMALDPPKPTRLSRFVPPRKLNDIKTPASSKSQPRTIQLSNQAEQFHTGDFDSPPHGQPAVPNPPKLTARERMQAKSDHHRHQPFDLTKNGKPKPGLHQSTKSPPPMKPTPRRASNPDTGLIIELPIKPYAFTDQLALPLGHVREQHGLTLTAGPRPDKDVLAIRRRTEQGWTVLVEAMRDDFCAVDIYEEPPILQFTFSRKRSKLKKASANLPLDPLFDGVRVEFREWRDNQIAENRKMTVVFDTEAGFNQHDFTRLVQAIRGWVTGTSGNLTTETKNRNAGGLLVTEYEPKLEQAIQHGDLGPRRQTLNPISSSPDRLALGSKPLKSSPVQTRKKAKQEDQDKLTREPPPKPKPKSKEPIDLTPHDKLRLVWPYKDDKGEPVPHGTRLVHGDLKRLDTQDEFLNDTLIDFELSRIRLAHDEQVKARLGPEAGAESDVHVFNSFFYKMLGQSKKRDGPPAYQSVRKWTSKFDLFAKQFVVIPVNEHLHWYLTIIVNPGAVLRKPQPKLESSLGEVRRGRSSIEGTQSINGPAKNAFSPTLGPDMVDSERSSSTTPQPDKPHSVIPNTMEIDVQATAEVHVIDDIQKPGPNTPERDVPDLLEVDSPAATAAAAQVDTTAEFEVEPERSSAQVVDSPKPESEQILLLSASQPRVAVSFGPSQRPPGDDTQVTDVGEQLEGVNLDQKQDTEPTLVQDQEGFDSSKCYIYTFDSLQSAHGKVVNKLRSYLDDEARDKKQVEEPSGCDAVGVEVYVPQQEGYSNCGLYILHYVERFLLDNAKIRDFIHTADGHAKPGARDKSIRYGSEAVQDAWDAEAAEGKRAAMRDELKALSAEWEAWNKPRQEAEHQATKEREERRKAKQDQQRQDVPEDSASTTAAELGSQLDGTQDSAIEVTGEPGKERSPSPGPQPVVHARATDVRQTAATAAFYAQRPSGATADTPASTGLRKSGRPLRKPKKSWGYDETRVVKARKDLGEITLSDSDDGTDDDDGRPAEPPKPGNGLSKAVPRAPSPNGLAAAATLAGVEQPSEGGTSTQAQPAVSEAYSSDTSSDNESEPSLLTLPEPVQDLPAESTDLVDHLAAFSDPHASLNSPAQPLAPLPAVTDVAEDEVEDDGPESPPRPKKPPRRMSITTARPDKLFAITIIPDHSLMIVPEVAPSPAPAPTPAPALQGASVHASPAHPARLNQENVLAVDSSASSVNTSSGSSSGGSERAVAEALSPSRKADRPGKRPRAPTPEPSGEPFEAEAVGRAAGGREGSGDGDGAEASPGVHTRKAKRAKAPMSGSAPPVERESRRDRDKGKEDAHASAAVLTIDD